MGGEHVGDGTDAVEVDRHAGGLVERGEAGRLEHREAPELHRLWLDESGDDLTGQ